MDLYSEVVELFNTSEKAFDIFFEIKQRIIRDNATDILIVYRNKRTLRESLIELKSRGWSVDLEKQYSINAKNEKVVHKTISECEKLDGYSFKTVFFL